jgi:hypothetical protein
MDEKPGRASEAEDEQSEMDYRRSLRSAVIVFAVVEAMVLIPTLIYLICKRLG